MRDQEASFKKGYKETMDSWKARLRKTAMSLPKAVVKEAVMNMKVRVKQCIDADGGLFE